MTTQKNRWTLMLVLLAAAVSAGSARVAGSQDAASHTEHHPAAPVAPAAPTPRAGQTGMPMMAAMQATDRQLDELLKKMNAATGTAKVDLMADIISKLVQERQSMHESMAHMSSMMPMMGGRGREAATPK